VDIRPARPGDAAAIAEIYNQGMEERQATFETEPRDAGHFAEPIESSEERPFLVAADGDAVLGFARVIQYSPRPCYDGVGEVSIYLERSARRAGLGRRLLDAMADEAARQGYWKLIGLIFPENRASVALMLGAGWREVGLHHRHGRLDGRWRDVLVLELLLGPATNS
jgi:L-amino acid N-acyltransferase YncA